MQAEIVTMPEIKTEMVWTNPEKIVDNRNIFERVLNINTHKIEKRVNTGQKFRGRSINCPGIFAFKQPVTLYKKIEEVETEGYLFYGIIPLEHKIIGTMCSVDYYVSKGR